MKEYIDKNRVEEILRNLWKKDDGYNAEHRICYNKALQEVQCELDTLEVKEVNLEKELDEWVKYGPHTSYPWCTIPDAIRITAERFFELGLKTKGE